MTTTEKPCDIAIRIGEAIAVASNPGNAMRPPILTMADIAHRVGRFDEQRETLLRCRDLIVAYAECKCDRPHCERCKVLSDIDAHLSLIGGEDE